MNRDLGAPDLKIEGLQMWVHSRCEDWLRVTVHSGGGGSSVWVGGEIVYLPCLTAWLRNLEAIAGDRDSACFENLEPEIDWSIRKVDSLGHFELRVEITPDHLTQGHWFTFGIDQSYLPGITSQVRRILARFDGGEAGQL